MPDIGVRVTQRATEKSPAPAASGVPYVVGAAPVSILATSTECVRAILLKGITPRCSAIWTSYYLKNQNRPPHQSSRPQSLCLTMILTTK